MFNATQQETVAAGEVKTVSKGKLVAPNINPCVVVALRYKGGSYALLHIDEGKQNKVALGHLFLKHVLPEVTEVYMFGRLAGLLKVIPWFYKRDPKGNAPLYTFRLDDKTEGAVQITEKTVQHYSQHGLTDKFEKHKTITY